MSGVMTLSDLLKAVAIVTSASGLSMLCANTSGELVKLTGAIRIDMTPQTLVLDDISDTSILSPTIETQGIPGGAGTGAMVITFVTGYGSRFQFLGKAGSGGNLYFRAYSVISAQWWAWQKVTMAQV